MIVTEEQARTKWCPHVRLLGGAACASYNRLPDVDGELPASSLCKASECMAWKWTFGHSPEERKEREPHGMAAKEPKGFCGL